MFYFDFIYYFCYYVGYYNFDFLRVYYLYIIVLIYIFNIFFCKILWFVNNDIFNYKSIVFGKFGNFNIIMFKIGICINIEVQ